jgi:hypothetical protein
VREVEELKDPQPVKGVEAIAVEDVVVIIFNSLSLSHPTFETCTSEAEFLDNNWNKSPKSFPLCYSQSPLLTVFTPLFP